MCLHHVTLGSFYTCMTSCISAWPNGSPALDFLFELLWVLVAAYQYLLVSLQQFRERWPLSRLFHWNKAHIYGGLEDFTFPQFQPPTPNLLCMQYRNICWEMYFDAFLHLYCLVTFILCIVRLEVCAKKIFFFFFILKFRYNVSTDVLIKYISTVSVWCVIVK